MLTLAQPGTNPNVQHWKIPQKILMKLKNESLESTQKFKQDLSTTSVLRNTTLNQVFKPQNSKSINSTKQFSACQKITMTHSKAWKTESRTSHMQFKNVSLKFKQWKTNEETYQNYVQITLRISISSKKC